MNTKLKHGLTTALVFLATALPVYADDMTMVLPIFASLFMATGVILALALWLVAKVTRVRTGVLIGILAVVTFLTGIPGIVGAYISIPYLSSRFADIAIPFLIGFVIYVAVLALAFRALAKRKQAESNRTSD